MRRVCEALSVRSIRGDGVRVRCLPDFVGLIDRIGA